MVVAAMHPMMEDGLFQGEEDRVQRGGECEFSFAV
jgi:hypothetical protein